MDKVYEYENYKLFVTDRVHAMPNQGFGQLRKIAQLLRIHTTRLSQILRGTVHFTPEQSTELCRFFGMNANETEYFLTLVELERAGTESLRAHLRARLLRLREQAEELVHRLPRERSLSESERAIFYSSWLYPAMSLATTIKGQGTIDALSARFSLPREKVRQIVDFLLDSGLCVENEKGELGPGTRLTHLESSSPLIVRHHANWRLKAMQRHENLGAADLSYSAPAVVSISDQRKIKELAAQFIESFLKIAKDSGPDEKLVFLNLDWLEM